jgi:hypothetical protein
MKYIDAERLREKIAEQMESLPREVGRGANTITAKGYGMMQAFQIMRSIIDTLQQKPAEWSEEDESKLQKCIKIVERWEEDYDIAYEPYSGMLKSLRPSWKPSEEQLKALLNAEGYLLEGDQFDSAKSIAQLYEQLKAIKEDKK